MIINFNKFKKNVLKFSGLINKSSVRYSISGNGVIYRKASNYLKDNKVHDFINMSLKKF